MTSPLFVPAHRPALRFRSRHVHMTVARFISEKLDELGWVTPPVNFNATAVTFREVAPDENGVSLAENTVSVTAGDVGEDAEQQLGGGLYEVVVPIFIDVYGQSSSIAQSIAEDVKEQVSRGRVLPLYNWSDVQAPAAVSGTYIELEAAVGPHRPQASSVSADFRKFWRVVKVEAHVHYSG